MCVYRHYHIPDLAFLKLPSTLCYPLLLHGDIDHRSDIEYKGVAEDSEPMIRLQTTTNYHPLLDIYSVTDA